MRVDKTLSIFSSRFAKLREVMMCCNVSLSVHELYLFYFLFQPYLQDSFQTLKNWVKELRQHGPPNIVVAIAGNKCDLSDAR